jgi:hypothetical protein
LHKISTDDGITIDFNPLSENAESSMHCNLTSASNATDSTEFASGTDDWHTTLSVDRITMDFNPSNNILPVALAAAKA